MRNVLILALLASLFVLGGCGAMGPKPDAAIQPVAVEAPVVDLEAENAKARPEVVSAKHTYARELATEACIERVLQATHGVDRTTGLTRATQACMAIWTDHARRVQDFRLLQDAREEYDLPVNLNNYNGDYLKVDLDSFLNQPQ